MKIPRWVKPAFWGRRRRGDHDPRLWLGGMGPGQHRGAHGQRPGRRSGDGHPGPHLRREIHGAGRCGGEAGRIPAQRVLAAQSTDCTRRVGDHGGQHRPEYGGGPDVRPTAREPQNLAGSTSQKERIQKPRHVRGVIISLVSDISPPEIGTIGLARRPISVGSQQVVCANVAWFDCSAEDWSWSKHPSVYSRVKSFL